MDDANRAGLAVREWQERLDRAQAELDAGTALPPDGSAGRRMQQAIDRARLVMDALGRGDEAIRAELPGERAPGSPGDSGEPGDPVVQRRGRPRKAEWRDVAPSQALLGARQARDAVLRLGVWSVLGDASAAAASAGRGGGVAALVGMLDAATVAVPPGIAPTLAYAGSSDAQAFFNEHLRSVLERIALRGAVAAMPGLWPMDRTAALAQRWSHAWSHAVCAVYADWLQRRGDGTLEGARRSLWQFNEREGPVRFRPADGLTVIPTKGFRLHVDLWLQPVLAQVLAFDAARWRSEGVDSRWHPVRLAIHDLTARDVGDSVEGSRTLYRGLSVEMLYQAVFIDRIAAALPRPGASDVAPADDRGAAGAAGTPGGGRQSTLDAARQHFDAIGTLGANGANGAVAALAPQQLAWHPATQADGLGADAALAPIGRVDLWAAMADGVAWLDFAAIARTAQGWVDLPLELVDAPAARTCTWLALPEGAAPSIAGRGIDVALLRRRLGHARHCRWMCRREGLGAFLTLGVDLRDPY